MVAVAQHIFAGSYHQNLAYFELDLSGPETGVLLWDRERSSCCCDSGIGELEGDGDSFKEGREKGEKGR